MEKLYGIITTLKNVQIKIYLIILIALFAFCGLFYLTHRQTHVDNIRGTLQPKILSEKAILNTQTTIGYVPKAKELVYRNNKPVYVQEDTDVEANIDKPQVTVKVNGKKTKFDLQQNETQKFENGKVVLDQKSTVEFDVKVPDRHELNVYGQEEFRAGKFHSQVGIDKQNGKLIYGAKYDITDKEPVYYVRYNLVKMYTN
nr:MAG TPA: hypothetical protein [Caudoviricetes sp.]